MRLSRNSNPILRRIPPVDGRALFDLYLESRNLKNTTERRTILSEIAEMDDHHFSADDLLVRFRNKGVSISRATIYRTLDHLVQSGLVRQLSLGRKHLLYESSFTRRHHEHLICLVCGSVIEFANDEVERLLEEVCRRKHFTSDRHSLQILGTCRTCGTHRSRTPSGRG